jgi:beta-galactosidase
MLNPTLRLFLFALLFLAFVAVCPAAQGQASSRNIVAIDASDPESAPAPEFLRMGGQSASGHTIGVNSSYLTLDGKPWLPVMGEFHFSRYPEKYWEEEILKMKAGGIQIVSTYVFWIHHEEIEGQFDWQGQRNLHHFVQLCGEHGMYVFVRIGPWAHGEARNGGLPDWLLKKGPTRKNDPVYLAYVQRFYQAIANQLQGLMWKDGGPVIGVQLENEYGEHGPDAGKAHILRLKDLALKVGLDAPIFTVTGWPDFDFPAGEVIPVFSAYSDGFWYGSLKPLPPSDVYLFNLRRNSGHSLLYAKFNQRDESLSAYPYFVAEGGGGMEVAYHRRPLIASEDLAADMLTHLGSGSNLYGYYMFQGGANPEGKLSTLQESSATDYPNDVPVVSYDFQAPLGEFGQMRPSFRELKLFHLFLEDFGESLAPMAATLPAQIPSTPEDTGPWRFALRSDGQHAFLFFNNYLGNDPLPARNSFQISVKLQPGKIAIPNQPVNIPSGAYFIWPINLDMSGATLEYATTQLVSKLDQGKETYYFFFVVPGILPQFAFDSNTITSVSAPGLVISRDTGTTYIGGIQPSTDVTITGRTRTNRTIHIVVLSHAQAGDLWKASFHGKEYMLFSPADLFFDEHSVHLRARDVSRLRFGAFPELNFRPEPGIAVKKTGRDGLFFDYAASVTPKPISVAVEALITGAPPIPVKMGKPFDWRDNVPVALPPQDRDYDRANEWKITVPKGVLDHVSDAFLRIKYVGDTARLYSASKLLDDDFYKGTVWEVGLKRFAPEITSTPLRLRIVPLRKDAPLYLPAKAWPDFGSANAIGLVEKIEISPEYEVRLDVSGKSERKRESIH